MEARRQEGALRERKRSSTAPNEASINIDNKAEARGGVNSKDDEEEEDSS